MFERCWSVVTQRRYPTCKGFREPSSRSARANPAEAEFAQSRNFGEMEDVHDDVGSAIRGGQGVLGVALALGMALAVPLYVLLEFSVARRSATMCADYRRVGPDVVGSE